MSGQENTFRWERLGTATASISRLFSECATGSRTMPVQLARRCERGRADSGLPSAAIWFGTAICPTFAPANFMAIASTVLTNRPHGHRFNPEQDRARSVCQGDRARRPLVRRNVRLQDRRSGRPTCRSTNGTTPTRLRWPSSSIRRSPGATIGRRKRPGTRRSFTKSTSRDSRSCIRTCPRSCAGPMPASPRRPAIDHLQKPGRHGRRVAAGLSAQSTIAI